MWILFKKTKGKNRITGNMKQYIFYFIYFFFLYVHLHFYFVISVRY